MQPDTSLFVQFASKPWALPSLLVASGLLTVLFVTFLISLIRDFKKRNTCQNCGSHASTEWKTVRTVYPDSLRKLYLGICEIQTSTKRICNQCSRVMAEPDSVRADVVEDDQHVPIFPSGRLIVGSRFRGDIS